MGTKNELVDPLLGPLQDNGGPTFTHALLAGSPAIDTGNPALLGSGGSACEATDQRGVARPQGSACDIGAYEATFQSVPPHVFHGTVTIDGVTAPDGSVVSAWASGEQVAETTVNEGEYTLLVHLPKDNALIFKIGDLDADQTATWEQGGADILNLTASSDP